ncbi:hypothetical protein [Streptomyces sp. NPDC001652]|uniref:hypothetical protein n=1 Tax=Streptomyces sp. NPDC001652 TaxID=3154393 RepID=UPI00332FCC17
MRLRPPGPPRRGRVPGTLGDVGDPDRCLGDGEASYGRAPGRADVAGAVPGGLGDVGGFVGCLGDGEALCACAPGRPAGLTWREPVSGRPR